MPHLVHLDHLIVKDSIYRIDNKLIHDITDLSSRYQSIPFNSIKEEDSFFRRLRKPDFQRSTNAWNAQQTVDFLDSVIENLLIPHIILWASPASRNIYILDGAHRVSVLRAWMTDDWGDGSTARRYYARFDRRQIIKAADEVSSAVREKIGSFSDCRKLADRWADNPTLSEMQMTDKQKSLVRFVHRMEDGDGLKIHWATGDYEYAAESFVRINQGGQRLDQLEVFLIAHRNNTFVRALMAIAGGTDYANYWPGIDKDIADKFIEQTEQFNRRATNIYRRLFEPSFDVPPTDVHQPLIPTTAAVRSQQTLRQLMPLILSGEVCLTKQSLERYFTTHYPSIDDASAIHQATSILVDIDEKLSHFSSLTNNDNRSLDIVPLFYWYNVRGGFVSALCYGFIDWLLGGGRANDDDVRLRKLIFSGNRDRFEFVMNEVKQQIALLTDVRGAGLKSVSLVAEFFDLLLRRLHDDRTLSGEDLIKYVEELFVELTNKEPRRGGRNVSSRRSARNTVIDTQGKISRLFLHNPRCPICKGHIDWKRFHQLEHIVPYRQVPKTTPQGTVEAHQFCNNNGDLILAYRRGELKLKYPEQQSVFQPLLFDVSDIDSATEWGKDYDYSEEDIVFAAENETDYLD